MSSRSAEFSRSKPAGVSIAAMAFSLLILSLGRPSSTIRAQDRPANDVHAGMSLCPWKKEWIPQGTPNSWRTRERVNSIIIWAGFFCRTSGTFILAEADIRNRWPSVRYAWPLCFVLSGVFVLIWSDTELWPFGPQSWYLRFSLIIWRLWQHKILRFWLLAVGVLELQRARGILRARWSGWIFPFLAVAGSSLLFFHEHQAGMHGPSHVGPSCREFQEEPFQFFDCGLRDWSFEGAGGNQIRVAALFSSVFSRRC